VRTDRESSAAAKVSFSSAVAFTRSASQCGAPKREIDGGGGGDGAPAAAMSEHHHTAIAIQRLTKWRQRIVDAGIVRQLKGRGHIPLPTLVSRVKQALIDAPLGGEGGSALHWDNVMSRVSALEREGYVALSFMYRYITRESCSQFDSLPLTYLSLFRYVARSVGGSSGGETMLRYCPSSGGPSSGGGAEKGFDGAEQWERTLAALRVSGRADNASAVSRAAFVAGTRAIVLRRSVAATFDARRRGGRRGRFGRAEPRDHGAALDDAVVLLEACDAVFRFAQRAAAEEMLSFHRMVARASLGARLDSRASARELGVLYRAWRLQSELRAWRRATVPPPPAVRAMSAEKAEARALEVAARWESALGASSPLIGALDALFAILGRGEGVAALGLRWQQQRSVPSLVAVLARLLPRAHCAGDDEKVRGSGGGIALDRDSSVAPSPAATRRRAAAADARSVGAPRAVAAIDPCLTRGAFRRAALGAVLLQPRPAPRTERHVGNGSALRVTVGANGNANVEGEPLGDVLLWIAAGVDVGLKTLLYRVGRAAQREATRTPTSAREDVGDDTKVSSPDGGAARSGAAARRGGVNALALDRWIERLSSLVLHPRAAFNSYSEASAQLLLGALVPSLSDGSALLRAVFRAACGRTACKADDAAEGAAGSGTDDAADDAGVCWDPLRRAASVSLLLPPAPPPTAPQPTPPAQEARAKSAAPLAPHAGEGSKREELARDGGGGGQVSGGEEPPLIRRVGLSLSASRGGAPLDHGLELDLDLARARSRVHSELARRDGGLSGLSARPIVSLQRSIALNHQCSVTRTGRTMLSAELHALCTHVCDVLEVRPSQAQSLLAMLGFRSDAVFEAFLREGRTSLLRRAGFIKEKGGGDVSSPATSPSAVAVASSASPPPLRSRSLSPTMGMVGSARPTSPFGAIECDICFECVAPEKTGALPGCAHSFCRECWQSHMRAASAVKDYVCPACPARMTRDDMLALGAADDVLAKFDARILLEFSLANPHTMRCPRCTCHIRLDASDDAGGATSVSNDVECRSVAHLFCLTSFV
jgi:hypothetical protein